MIGKLGTWTSDLGARYSLCASVLTVHDRMLDDLDGVGLHLPFLCTH